MEKITYTYVGDGSKKVFPINWPYIDKGFVRVYLQRDPRDEVKEDITPSCQWLSDSQIEILPAPPSDSTVFITRETPTDRALTIFRDGSTQLAENLNTVSMQMLHIAQESRDYTQQVHDYVGKAEGYLEQLEGLSVAVERAETAAERAVEALEEAKTAGEQFFISDSVTSDDSRVAASSKAVKTAYDTAVMATIAADGAQAAAQNVVEEVTALMPSTATMEEAGIVRVDGTSITVDGEGVISIIPDTAPKGIIGEIRLLPFRIADLPAGWYYCNGERYSLTSKQGIVLNSLPAAYKTDWGVSVSDGTISIPSLFYSDGRGAFIRTGANTPGVWGDDTMRPITGTASASPNRGWQSYAGALYANGGGSSNKMAAESGAGYSLGLNSGLLGPNYNGYETTPLFRYMTPAIFLGV